MEEKQTIQLILEILTLGAAAASSLTTGGAHDSALLAESLVGIGKRVADAYLRETGQPLDWSKIQRIEPIA